MALKHQFVSQKPDGPDPTVVRPLNWNDLHFGELFNYTYNGDFEVWGAGPSAAPTGYVFSGAGGTVAKDTTNFRIGTASVALTRSGTDVVLEQSPQPTAMKEHGGLKFFQGQTAVIGCWVRATVGSRARIACVDDQGITHSAYHSGSGNWEWLRVLRVLANNITGLTAKLFVDSGNTTAQFDGLTFCIGVVPQDFVPSGWRGRKYLVALGTDSSTTVAAGLTRYLSIGAYTSETPGVGFAIPHNAVVRRAHFGANVVAGAGQSFTYTIQKNGSDTALTGTISGASALTATDLVNEVAYTSGERIACKLVVSAGAAGTHHKATVEVEEIP